MPLSTPALLKERTLTQIEMQISGAKKHETFRNEEGPAQKLKTRCYGSTSLACAGESATEEQPWEEIGGGMNSSGTKDYRRHRGGQVCQPR
jgi:hypothetical protein